MTDLRTLRELAEKATGGDWRARMTWLIQGRRIQRARRAYEVAALEAEIEADQRRLRELEKLNRECPVCKRRESGERS